MVRLPYHSTKIGAIGLDAENHSWEQGMGGAALAELEARMATAHLRGQWQHDANRPQNVGHSASGHLLVEPLPAGAAHVWRWRELEPLLASACEAMPESLTARRALILSNPKLQRGTTHTLLASIQAVRPGEIAWAHRHAINALRFAIQGSERAFTVVEGRELAMESYDLILTPGWTWHDHHNEDLNSNAIWLDALDVPFTLALNQQFYEEFGDAAQARTSGDIPATLFRERGASTTAERRPYRYSWQQARQQIDKIGDVDPSLGFCVEYVNPSTSGPVLPTISCRLQVLPPGFEGQQHRTTASEIAFVIEGQGSVLFGGEDLTWESHDCLALPNWAFRRFINRSSRDRAVLFTISDAPILSAFGFLRTEGLSDTVLSRRPVVAAE